MSQLADASTIEELLVRAEEAPDPRMQAGLLLRAAFLYEVHEQPDRAFFVRCTAYRVLPTPSDRLELERLAAQTGRADELDALLVETTPALPLEERADAWCDLGRLRLKRLRAPERALEVLDVALALRAGNEAASLRAEALQQLGRYAELIDALEALADAAVATDERCRILLRLVDLFERSVTDADRAEETCRRILAIDPRMDAARARLERLVRARADLPSLIGLLDDRHALAPDDAAALQESAELCEKLGHAAEAAERWEQLRARRPADLTALRALDRLYAQLERLRERARVLEALVGVVESERERAELHRELAKTWTELGERPHAIASLEWLLDYEPGEAALRAIEPLYRADARFGALADAWMRHVRAIEPAARAPLLRELAGLFEHDLQDAGQAIACWEELADADPQDGQALDALARLYESIEAFDRAIEARERWATLAHGRQRALRLVRAAELCASRTDEPAHAEQLLERALQADSSCVPVRLALAGLHGAAGELGRALELVEGTPASDHPALRARAATLHEAQGQPERALSDLRAVLERAPDHLEARRRACALALQLQHWVQALELAAGLPDDGAPEVRLERWVTIARAAQATGDRARATQATAHAVELAPDRLEVRQLRAERLLAEDRAAEAELLLTELDQAEMPPAQGAAIAFLAGECAHARGDADEALRRYRRALALDPAHRSALRRVLDLVVELERWEEALEALSSLVRLEADTRLRARYRHLAGHVCEEELGRHDDALAHYRAALADDADHPRCAERIEGLLRERGDFAGLAEHCARALDRLGDADVARKAQLWRTLAEAAEQLGDRDGAIAALEVVVRLDGGSQDARHHLAELYVTAGPDAIDRAIGAHHEALCGDKLHVPTYRALASLYRQRHDRDRALACDRAARLLSAHETTRERPRAAAPEPVLATRPLADADWRLLRHADEDRFLSTLSVLLSPLLASVGATPIDRAHRTPGVPVARNDSSPFVQATGYVARMFEVARPELFTRDDQTAPVRFVNARVGQTVRPAFVVGLPLLGDRRRVGDLIAPLALEAALLRSERSLRIYVGEPRALAIMLRAVIVVAHDETPSAGEGVTAAAFRRWLQPLALDQLGVVGRRLRQDGRDLERLAAEWLRAADLTAARATLALTGDLERTLEAVDCCAASPRAALEARRELIWASITDALWTVRQHVDAAPLRAGQTASDRPHRKIR